MKLEEIAIGGVTGVKTPAFIEVHSLLGKKMRRILWTLLISSRRDFYDFFNFLLNC
jgi:hypothetical protein